MKENGNYRQNKECGWHRGNQADRGGAEILEFEKFTGPDNFREVFDKYEEETT